MRIYIYIYVYKYKYFYKEKQNNTTDDDECMSRADEKIWPLVSHRGINSFKLQGSPG